MIYCVIDNKICYPVAQNAVKISCENPFMSKGGEKTMELTFPMSIPENRAVFGPLNRLDTHFQVERLADCRLIAGVYEIIRGTGRVTAINETVVKMQILCGKSSVRYKSSFEDIYIDKISYGSILPRHEYLRKRRTKTVSDADFSSEMRSQGFVGNPGVYAFLPIHDESNDVFMNMPAYLQDDDGGLAGISMSWAAIQPNLMHVLNTVMLRLGYTVRSNEYNVSPWRDIYIASARVTMDMAKALPHWTAATFLDEFRKTFNAVYLFDEHEKTVDIISWDSMMTEVEYCQAIEGFSSGFNEDGVEYLGSSNLTYSLSSNERSPDFLSEEMTEAFDIREYESLTDMHTSFNHMEERQRMTTLFKCKGVYYYSHARYDDNGDIFSTFLQPCGFFSPLVRRNGGSNIDLRMVPVAVSWQECLAYVTHIYGGYPGLEGTFFENTQNGLVFEGPCANIDNDEDVPSGEIWCYWSRYREKKTTDYTSIQDILEEGEGIPKNNEDDGTMQMIFAAGSTLEFRTLRRTGEAQLRLEVEKIALPMTYTDRRMFDTYMNLPPASMSLIDSEGLYCIGRFHNRGLEIRHRVNGNDEITIPFLYDGKPDPTRIYQFGNKRFICSKIEMSVDEVGIDRVKTGYFYEMIS